MKIITSVMPLVTTLQSVSQSITVIFKRILPRGATVGQINGAP